MLLAQRAFLLVGQYLEVAYQATVTSDTTSHQCFVSLLVLVVGQRH